MTDTTTHYEFETTPFTDHERKSIAAYEAAIEGIPDSFDQLDTIGFGSDEVLDDGTTIAYSAAEAPSVIRQYFNMLTDWHTALDTLYSALCNHGANQGYSVAGSRFITEQVKTWYHLLNLTRREACKTLVGTAGPEPEVDAGYVTFFNVPGIELDGTIAAESR